MHRVDQRGDVVGLDVRGDAVAEVEHMPGTVAEARQYVAHVFADDRRTGVQYRRVEGRW